VWTKPSEKKMKKLFRVFFPKQVKMDFPIAMLSDYVDREWKLPEGYTIL